LYHIGEVKYHSSSATGDNGVSRSRGYLRRHPRYDKDWTVRVKIWTEISGERLAGNFAALEHIAQDAVAGARLKTEAPAVLAVVKANAYGHGIDPCAAILAEAGAEWLGVTDAHEGAAVRKALVEAGIAEDRQPKVLVMCGTAGLPGEAETILRNRLTAVVWSCTHLDRLTSAAMESGLTQPVEVHLEIDSGMSRQGVVPGHALEGVLEKIAGEPLLALGGVMTHFASTEVANSAQTEAQQKSFEAAMGQVVASGLKPGWVHVGNSSYIDNAAEGESPLRWLHSVAARAGARAMVRSGLALYGYLLPIEGRGHSLAGSRILPVMTWKTRVIAVSTVEPGAAVGYNGTFIAQRPMRLALLPVGYADGLRRELSSMNTGPNTEPNTERGGWVMVRGKRAPILGRISMNLTTVDVTGIDGTIEGDQAVLLGDGITADDHARLAGTIAYEILCGVRTSR
jgi:alanine racemase